LKNDLPFPIIRSKLHPPPVAPDAIRRHRLSTFSPAPGQTSFTLISAPAGYGKSTIASQWLDSSPSPSLWLSLDASDDELRQFLTYVVAAIRSKFRDSCEATTSSLNVPDLPAPEQLARTFCIDCESLDSSFVLVLDDYHYISSEDVHEFLNALLRRPPSGLSLVILTRRDPPLALQSLRVNGKLLEIRSQQLAFTQVETEELIERAFADRFSRAAMQKLHQKTEGWPAGIRLAMLAAPQSATSTDLVDGIPSDTHAVRTYLLQEVLDACSAEERELLLRTAFLDRFCAEICEAVLPDELSRTLPGGAGARFMDRIRETGLFGIALDSYGEWYRYHHLFQSMLQELARGAIGEGAIEDVHVRASRWLRAHGFFEESIRYLLSAGRPEDAAAIIVDHRYEIMNAEQWIRLSKWLNLLPEALISSRPELLLLVARLHRTRGGRNEAQKALDAAEKALVNSVDNDALRRELQGSFESSRCYQLYATSQGAAAVASATRALELLPPEAQTERGFALIILGGGMQMIGDAKGARAALYAAMPRDPESSRTIASRVLLALGFVNWMDGDLTALQPIASRALEIAIPGNVREVQTAAQSFLASIEYHRNELAAVVARLGNATGAESIMNAEFHAQNMIIAALAHQELGHGEQASAIAARLGEAALKYRSAFLIELSDALNAELALRQGHLAQAMKWVREYDGQRLTPMYSFMAPQMVFAKLLVLADTDVTRGEAQPYLDRLVEYLASIHNTHFLAEALAVRALLREATGQSAAAHEDLGRAVELAQPSRYIRLFADYGPRMLKLLSSLTLDEEGVNYVGEILAAGELHDQSAAGSITVNAAAGAGFGVELLSKREQQILGLLARRLSNKEIANALHISEVTVKRHAANIYEKLGVHSRRQAVAKAAGLGMFKAQAGGSRSAP